MSVAPETFRNNLFPEINATLEFRGLTYVFFEQFSLPTAEQLDLIQSTLPGWSLITWGWWNDDADIEDQDIEGITEEGDSFEDFSEENQTVALTTFGLNAEGLPLGDRQLQPIDTAAELEQIFPEGDNWGLVAISCPNWRTVSACEWRDCMNVAEPDEMALTLKKWQDNWGIEALAFGGEEDDADLLVRIPAEHEANLEMYSALRVAADQVTIFKDDNLGQLANLWFD
ncbi:hypothetical protein AUP71_13255 [Corynebacterium glutamicum]|uniref:hypothetical protein n=1 Tax=Corynebacterium glutamicum TaxID=1718 RepID=UPI0009437FBB|nr:hypothetical protein [Corynebacterium glutamicum]OKX92435.1 hypothetical protein AUP71_13255 [Corynebacterium glutamicum]